MDRLKVLLAENDTTDRDEIMDYAATLNDIEIVGVTDTPTATVEAVRDLSPEALLLDLGLKHADDLAITTLREMRSLRLKFVPYIIIPTYQMSDYVQDAARKCGADYIYPKYQQTDDWQKGVVDMARALDTIARQKWESTGSNWKTEAERTKELNERIADELDKVNISRRNMDARELLTEAILLSMEAPQPYLYLTLSEKHNRTEAETVTIMEKAIRRAWRSLNVDIDALLENYRGRVSSYTGVPAVTHFITYYANKLKSVSP
jgi:DNA-binding NarL/FixJ family response regulator